MIRISFKGIFTLDEHILILDTLKELKRGEWVVYKDEKGRIRINGGITK